MKETEWAREEAKVFGPIYTECVSEYTLPDYLPDIRKVLSVKGQLMPIAPFLSDEQAEWGGSCVFSVLYTSPEGKAAALSIPVEYRFALPFGDKGEEEIKFFEHSKIEQISCRLTGPRKLQAKAAVVSRPKWWQEKEQKGARQEDNLVLLKKEWEFESTFPFHFQCKPIAATLPLTGKDLQLLSSEGCVFIRELTKEKDKVTAKGEVRVEAILAGEDGIPFTLGTKVNFEEVLPPEVNESSLCLGQITAMEVELREEEEAAEVIFDMEICLFGESKVKEMRSLVRDAFSLNYPTEVKMGEIELSHRVAQQSRFFTLEGRVDRVGDVAKEPLTVANTSCLFDTPTCSLSGQKLVAETVAHITMLLLAEGGEEGTTLLSHSFDYPVKMEIDLAAPPPKDTVWEGILTAAPAHGRLDQSKLFFDIEVCLTVLGSISEHCTTVEQVDIEKISPFEKERHSIVAVYLTEGDSLWSIAKHYHANPGEIAEQNGLGEEVLENLDKPYALDGYIRLLITT